MVLATVSEDLDDRGMAHTAGSKYVRCTGQALTKQSLMEQEALQSNSHSSCFPCLQNVQEFEEVRDCCGWLLTILLKSSTHMNNHILLCQIEDLLTSTKRAYKKA